MKLSVVVWVLLSISSSGLPAAHAEPQKNTREDTFLIGYSGSPQSIDYWYKLHQALFSRAKELGVIVVDFSSHEFTFEAQLSGLHLAAKLNVDGMIIGAVTDGIGDSIDAFRDKKIPVVAVGTAIVNNVVSATVAIDEHKASGMAGRYILERLETRNSNANRVVILCGEEVQRAARIRASVPMRLLTEAGYEVQRYHAKGWTAWQPLSDVIAEFSAHGEKIAAVFACYADASIASVEAAKAYELRPLLVGFDMDQNMRSMIRDGSLDGTIVQDPERIGRVGIETMIDILSGNIPSPKFIDIPAHLVTRENIQNY